ncbi:mandelate racemase/muconate lactonizing enzyme family protein [Roseovarius sp. 2305UL8-3]|uniref:mandelate racemase/muconate lactonizing enzyme family protein n=1 Tax=Roseovarius conchicola TaxID=3121636 RepID=UPI0035294311
MMTDRIARIDPYCIPADARAHPWWSHKPYVLVRVQTEEGLIGWGECHILNHREPALIAMARALGDWLIGRPAGDIRGILNDALGAFGLQIPGAELYSAFAGIEIALWDISGKRLNAPVYQLLGGACHDTVPVYANIYSPHPQTPDAFAEMALRQVADGYRAIKLYPFKRDSSIADGVAVMSAVRNAVGPDIGLAVDFWRHASPARAIELARALEPFDLSWIEDPFAPTDAASYRYLRDTIKQPLLTGETLATRRDFADLFAERAVDIVNPDICLSGLLELQAIAAMAEPAMVTVSPHNANSMALGTAAVVHAALGMSNLGLTEHFPLFDTALDDLCSGRMQVINGEIHRPIAPGIGITFDETAMAPFRV